MVVVLFRNVHAVGPRRCQITKRLSQILIIQVSCDRIPSLRSGPQCSVPVPWSDLTPIHSERVVDTYSHSIHVAGSSCFQFPRTY